jgi:hypothetical protein
MDGSSGSIDNFQVQVLPPDWTLDQTDDFIPPAEFTRVVAEGDWNETSSVLSGTALASTPAVQVIDLGASLSANSILEMEVNVKGRGLGGFVFDRYDALNYKFVALDATNDQVIIGHATSKDGIVIDATFVRDLDPNAVHRLKATMQGAGIAISVDSVPVTSYAFNAALVDGGFGLLVLEGSNDFASLDVRTNDPQFDQPDVPRVSISDVMLSETEAGQTEAWLTVSLSEVLGSDVTVGFSTADGSAIAGQDYLATDGLLTFAAGETTKTIGVTVIDDSDVENDESFFVILSDANGVELGNATGVVTITDNDVPVTETPTLSISDVQISEGDKKSRVVTLTVTLSGPSTDPVNVDWMTADGTATLADGDYVAAAGTLTIAAGETSGSIEVWVNSDRGSESDETFQLLLSNPVNATLADAEAQVTILDDDSKLLAASDPGAISSGEMALTEARLAPVVDSAIDRWEDTGILSQTKLEELIDLEFAVVDLDGRTLGETRDGCILIDLDAAGFGWFIDDTPWDDLEFARNGDNELIALANDDAYGKMDLLTAVMHEIGHFIGIEHNGEQDSLMHETLDTGVRKNIPTLDSADTLTQTASTKVTDGLVFDENTGEFDHLSEYNVTTVDEDYGIEEKSLLLRDLLMKRVDDESDDWVIGLNVLKFEDILDKRADDESDDWVIGF